MCIIEIVVLCFYWPTDFKRILSYKLTHDFNNDLIFNRTNRMSLMIVDNFGWDLGNGSFSGLTGKLQREECDFGGIGNFIRADRMTAIDYTVGTFCIQ